MLYPHEREERKALFATLIEESRVGLGLKPIATALMGVCVAAFAVLNSSILQPSAEASAFIWGAMWFAFFCIQSFLILLLPLFTKQKVWGIKRGFVIKQLLPPFVVGQFVCLLLAHQGLPAIAASCWILFYAIGCISISTFCPPSWKNYSASMLIIGLSTLVVTARHTDFPIYPHHLANIILIAGIALPSLAFAGWKLLVKRH